MDLRTSPTLITRPGQEPDVELCVALWVHACAVRDGVYVPGVGDRARDKFTRRIAWTVAEQAGELVGFVLCTEPGSGAAADPPDAAVVGLLVVEPRSVGLGIGGRLMECAADTLREAGYARAVLHVLADNTRAVRVYERAGWHASGEVHPHPLLDRPMQTYERTLASD